MDKDTRRSVGKAFSVETSFSLIGHMDLEKLLGTFARIYYKNEGVSPPEATQTEHCHCPGILQ